ncbi:MAG: hypothetical protein KAW12_08980 [Candidatus Aminicenantes bacterium]|nr:hypothetical protein [Candidatus Aminicenantes bacterium]
MKLPHAKKAFVDIEKLRGYCLNPFHIRGKHKARIFSSVLGLTSKDAEKLRKALLEAANSCDAVPGVEDQYGKRYIIDFLMTTTKGQAKIRSTWIVLKHEHFPKLTSCFIPKKED